MSTDLAPVLIPGKHDADADAIAPAYHPRLGSPFLLPDTIVTHRRFKDPATAVSWFADMVRRAEMLTGQRLWSKAMQKRAALVAAAQDKALADWKGARAE